MRLPYHLWVLEKIIKLTIVWGNIRIRSSITIFTKITQAIEMFESNAIYLQFDNDKTKTNVAPCRSSSHVDSTDSTTPVDICGYTI